MRIVAGAWRGRALVAPKGDITRPTSERLRQALFDMIWHAPWGGRAAIEGVAVLDAFAGTGALGLEALSRGAGRATFMERDRAALAALRANVVACGAVATVLAADATRPPRGEACAVVFLDPPYGQELVPRAVAALRANVANCAAVASVLQVDATRPPRGEACALVFLDPPYGQGLVPRAVAALDAAGWIAPGALIVAEVGATDRFEPPSDAVATRGHGAGRVVVWRHNR